MRFTAIVLYLLTTITANAATHEEQFVRAAKDNIERQLVDPASAQYRNLYVAKHGNDLILCGEMNAKNRMGGYDGFRQFISSERGIAYSGEQIDALLPEYCGHKVRDLR